MVQRSSGRPHLVVTADGTGVAAHVGTRLLGDMADALGLTDGLSAAMAPTRQRRSAHDPGRVLVDLVLNVAGGGTSLSDLKVLRDQPEVFGTVASDPTAWRVLASVDEEVLVSVDAARAAARATAWAAGARPPKDFIVLDFDATLVTSHSEKEKAAANYKHGFGFHPLLCFVDATNDAVAGVLRPGNAGSNTAADHIAVLDAALAQLPVKTTKCDPQNGEWMLARADSAGCTHDFLDALRDRGLEFSVGFPMDGPVREAVLALPETAWTGAIRQDMEVREGAEVAEVTDLLDLSAWPTGTRAIVRREEPHPGAQLSFTDINGHRSRSSSATPPTPTSPTWRRVTGAMPGSRTASATPSRPAWPTSHVTHSPTTSPGWRWCSWPVTCWHSPSRCAWRTSWPPPSRSGSATAFSTPPLA